VTGVVGALRTVGIENEVASQPTAPWLLMVSNPTAVLAVLVAAALIWKRRRLGAGCATITSSHSRSQRRPSAV
jgi:hypothetical protein